MVMGLSHDTRTVIEIYECTARDVGTMLTGDGQQIPIVSKTCKLVCSCGNIYLDEQLFSDEPESE